MPTLLERPPAPQLDEAAPSLIPEPAPQLQRHWWRFRFPWTKTAVGAPLGDEQLLIDNQTPEVWTLHLGYHALGPLAPHRQRYVTVATGGLLTARPLHAPVGTAYLTLYVVPAVRVVEIRAVGAKGAAQYELHAVRPPHPAAPH
jgi:hypothetical protein